MATNIVELEVIVDSKEAEKGFERLEQIAEAVGESFTNVSKAVSDLGKDSSKSLEQVGDSVNDVSKALSSLGGDSSKALGQVDTSVSKVTTNLTKQSSRVT